MHAFFRLMSVISVQCNVREESYCRALGVVAVEPWKHLLAPNWTKRKAQHRGNSLFLVFPREWLVVFTQFHYGDICLQEGSRASTREQAGRWQ